MKRVRDGCRCDIGMCAHNLSSAKVSSERDMHTTFIAIFCGNLSKHFSNFFKSTTAMTISLMLKCSVF